MKKTLSMAAAAILLGSTAIAPVAFAQDTTDPASPSAPAAPGDPALIQPAPDASTSAPAVPNDSAAATAPASYLTEQAPTQISANTFIGQSVYNSADESIGRISDLILEQDGGIVAAVVGVGGFLGIGQKNVAVPIDNVTVTQDATTGDIRLTTMETAESLQGAPEFKTLSMQAAEAESNALMPMDNTTTSSTNP